MSGYIKIPRDLFDTSEFSGEKFSKREAFIDLVQMAAYKPTTVIWKGREYGLERGQLLASRRYLSSRWRWDKGRVVRFVTYLCASGRCVRVSIGQSVTVLSITDYDSYNGDQEQRTKRTPSDGGGSANGNEDSVNRLYALYPTKCPVSGRGTGKSSKDKKKLETLLKRHSEEELAGIIARYLSDCAAHQSYIKNFATFLNNLPDYGGATSGERPSRPGPDFSDPGAYVGDDGKTHTHTSYKTVEELDAARSVREREYEKWKKSNEQ